MGVGQNHAHGRTNHGVYLSERTGVLDAGLREWKGNPADHGDKSKAEARRILRERETKADKGEKLEIERTTWLDASAALLDHYRAYGARDPLGGRTPTQAP